MEEEEILQSNQCAPKEEMDFEEIIEINPDGLDFDEMIDKLINQNK